MKKTTKKKPRCKPATGWKCPECQIVHAPDVKECRCVAKKVNIAPFDRQEALKQYEKDVSRIMEEYRERMRRDRELPRQFFAPHPLTIPHDHPGYWINPVYCSVSP